jgi:hypothetical protein
MFLCVAMSGVFAAPDPVASRQKMELRLPDSTREIFP